MILKRFLNTCRVSRVNKMGDILETYYQNGLTNYSSQENKDLLKWLVQEYKEVFSHPNQIKRWITRRKAKEKENTLNFPHVIADGEKLPDPVEVTSLILPAWEQYLHQCPLEDKTWVLESIQSGFSLNCESTEFKNAAKNLSSANVQPDIVDSYLEMEISSGTMAGPFQTLPFKDCQINRFGVIPKSDGKFRMITDLSYPHGHSINDGVSKENAAVSYIGLTAAIKKILSLGPGCLLAKFDIQRAYRMIAIRSDERRLLVMQWKGLYFVDLALPFGARSAPRIFTRFSDVLEWVLKTHGPVRHMQHSLDDFLICGPAGSSECYDGLARSFELCIELGVPIEHNKTKNPTTNLVFLGMEIDTELMEMRIPDDKLEKIRQLLDMWVRKKSGTKRSLLSLVGSLYYCCQAVVVGKPFVIRLTKKAYSVEQFHYTVELNADEIEDLMWWYYLLNSWNGRSFLSDFHSRNVVKLNS